MSIVKTGFGGQTSILGLIWGQGHNNQLGNHILFSRGGNNGGSWDPSSQKIFGLTENFQLNCSFFVMKIKFW